MSEVIIMDLSGTYPGMDMPPGRVIDCTGIGGSMRYCEPQAYEALRTKVRDSAASPRGIHFIDGGDYHYLSMLWTGMLAEPFSLIVFDHHPDMQPPLFDGVLSCGGWVAGVLDGNPMLDKVLLAGISPSLAGETLPWKDRVLALDEGSFTLDGFREALGLLDRFLPVYLSIDKDVLGRQWARTNWDQGSLSLPLLEKAIEALATRFRVIGADICGLDPESADPDVLEVNSRTDRELASFLRGILSV